MKLIVQAPFDLGVSFGLDESPFETLERQISEDEKQRLFPFEILRKQEPPSYQRQMFGRPLRISIPAKHPLGLLELWRTKAEEYANPLTATDTNEADEHLLALVQKVAPTRLYIDAFSIGAAIVCLEFADFPDDEAKWLIRFYRTYEWPGYTAEIADWLKDSVLDIVRGGSEAWRVKPIVGTERKPTRDLFKFFNFVIVSNNAATAAIVKVLLAGWAGNNDPLELCHFEYFGDLEFAWTGQLIDQSWCSPSDIQPDATKLEPETIQYVLYMQYVAHQAFCSFDALLREHSGTVLQSRSAVPDYMVAGIRRSCSFARLISDQTQNDSFTENAEIVRVCDVFESKARMGFKRTRLLQNAAHLEGLCQALEDEARRKHEHRFMFGMMILTALTAFSAGADVVGGLDFTTTLFTEALATQKWLWRFFFLTVFFFVVLGLFLVVVYSPRVSKWMRDKRVKIKDFSSKE